MKVRVAVGLVVVVSMLAVTMVAFAQETSKVQRATAPRTSAGSGKEMYTSYCASCHGADGTGKGPAASAMKVPPSDLTTIRKNNGGKFPSAHIYQVIKGDSNTPAHGSKDMPVWGPLFLRMSGSHEAEVHQRIDNLTKYIESLQKD